LVVYTPPGYSTDREINVPTLYLQHGSGDNQATWTVQGKAYHKQKEIEHEWHMTEGDHSWRVWRRHLADFVPKLFQ
jgi:enterochelin esterase-like enzyme